MKTYKNISELHMNISCKKTGHYISLKYFFLWESLCMATRIADLRLKWLKADKRYLNKKLCHCGKPILKNFDPCCSLKCWYEKFNG